MADKLHKSLRLDSELVKRIDFLKYDGESQSAAMCRIMAAGCEALEARSEHGANIPPREDANKQIIEHLEAEKARLIGMNDRLMAAIAEKDAAIYTALDRAYELAEQSHILIGMSSDAGAPERQQTDVTYEHSDDENAEPVEVDQAEHEPTEQAAQVEPVEEPPRKRRGFMDWLLG